MFFPFLEINTLYEKYYISNKWSSFELLIHQGILKRITVSTKPFSIDDNVS